MAEATAGTPAVKQAGQAVAVGQTEHRPMVRRLPHQQGRATKAGADQSLLAAGAAARLLPGLLLSQTPEAMAERA